MSAHHFKTWLLALTLVTLGANVAAAQGATADLFGDWEHKEESLHIFFRFAPGDKATMWVSQGVDGAPTASGSYSVKSESFSKKKERIVKIDLTWTSNPKFVHKVIITYHNKDRYEMAFNSEPIRLYNRVPRPAKQADPSP